MKCAFVSFFSWQLWLSFVDCAFLATYIFYLVLIQTADCTSSGSHEHKFVLNSLINSLIVWERYQRVSNQRTLSEGQAIQWPKGEGQEQNTTKQQRQQDKTGRQNTTQKNENWATQNPHKTVWRTLMLRKGKQFCSTSETCRVTRIKNLVITHE